MLASAQREYDRQARLTALAVAETSRIVTRSPAVVARTVQTYQAAAIALSMQTLGSILAEQGIDTAASAVVNAASLLTEPRAVTGMLEAAANSAALVRVVETLVRDAGRTARAVDTATRPAVTGYVRSLRLPSCGRCVILAGRVYRWSDGFLRHPRCDCLHTPVADAGPELITDPDTALRRGQVTGLSQGDLAAVRAGADLGQVVNVRRKAAGLTTGSSVMVRAGRLTPQACMSLASDRQQALQLLRRYGYVT